MPSYKVQDFIAAIPGTGGVITHIAQKVGCTWHTAKKYVTGYSTVQRAYDNECEKVLDAAETAIISVIMPPKDKAQRAGWEADLPTVKWYLTMKGGGRGYAPKRRLDIKVSDLDNAIERELARMADSGESASTETVAGAEDAKDQRVG